MCSHNNNIPINIPGHPYVLMNQSILCNCDIETESNFLLESLAACEGPDAINRPRNAFYSEFSLYELFRRYTRKFRKTYFIKLDNTGTNSANIA